MPLCHGLERESRKTNQTNIGIRLSFFASAIAWETYVACWASVTPFGSPGFVSLPYSVT